LDVGGGSTEFVFLNGKLINSRSFKAGTVRLLNDMVCDVVWDEIEKIKINTGNMKKLF
jgi:exopolyphosphatase/guanosine-5'-triphosphate,3'-diphosphate pyrophosphatase